MVIRLCSIAPNEHRLVLAALDCAEARVVPTRYDQRERLSLGCEGHKGWTPSDPFRPDEFGYRIAIFVDQIIHVSHSRSREHQPKPLAAPRGAPKILVKVGILDELRAGFRQRL